MEQAFCPASRICSTDRRSSAVLSTGWPDARTQKFRGRKVVILLQRKRGRHDLPGRLVVSMETGAAAAMEPLDFAGYRPDRGTELALFALEAKHEAQAVPSDGCPEALWQPIGFFIFPGRFERPKWQSVLEAMHTLADSVARRAA